MIGNTDVALSRLVKTRFNRIIIGLNVFDVLAEANDNRVALTICNDHTDTSWLFQLRTIDGDKNIFRLSESPSEIHLTLAKHGDLCQKKFVYNWNGLDDSSCTVIEYIVPERVLQVGLESFNVGGLPWL